MDALDEAAYQTRLNLERLLDRIDTTQPLPKPKPKPAKPSGRPLKPDRPAFNTEALCAHTSLDFLETEAGPISWKTNPDHVADLIAVCDQCRLREPCLDWALAEGNIYGIWGGMTPRERKRMLTSVP